MRLPARPVLVAAIALVWIAWLLTRPPRPSAALVAASGLPFIIAVSWAAWARVRRRAAIDADPAMASWPAFLRAHYDLHALALLLLAALGVQFADTHGITTDGVIYFTQLRSAIFDGDLDVGAEFAYLQQPPRPGHVVPIGPTFIWLPLYLAVAAVDWAGRALGLWPAPPTPVALGLTLPYVRAALLSSFAIGAVGLVALQHRLRSEFPRWVALCATTLLCFGTPLVWYMVYEPSMTHAASFGLVALFVLAAERYTAPDIGRRRAVLLGALVGLAFMTRPQEALFAVFPAMLLAFAPGSLGVRVRSAVRLAGWAFLGALPWLLAQAVHTLTLVSRERFALVGDGGYLDFFRSRWADALWSSWHGFFSWTPLAYLAFLALFFYLRRHRAWAAAGIVIVVAMAWVNGATTDWAGGWSFGGRRFVSVLVVLAPALALIVDALRRRPMIAVSVLAGCAIVWNQLLVANVAGGHLGSDGVSFASIVRRQAALATEPPFVYPFAFPANAWFAWRTGLPIDRYDLLAPMPLAASFAQTMSGDAGRYLLEGWGSHVSDVFGELRWIDGERAEMVVPLDPPADRPVEVTLRARTRLLDPPEQATLALLVNGQDLGTLTPTAHEPSTHRFVADAGVLTRGVNRVTFVRRSGRAAVAVYQVELGARN